MIILDTLMLIVVVIVTSGLILAIVASYGRDIDHE